MGALRLWPLVLGVLGACVTQSDPSPPYYGGGGDGGGWGTGPGGGGGSGSFGCHVDTDCGSDVCARDGSCQAAADVRVVHVTWTVRDMVASSTTCASEPDLEITFAAANQMQFGFAPVPCVEGKFTVDKLPLVYTSVSLALEGDYNGGDAVVFDANGDASLNLPY